MQLYYAPLACSLAAHIACREADLDVELIRVDLPTKRSARGEDFLARNAMGQVPTLVLADGRTLTENVAVLAYLAEREPGAENPSSQASDRYELIRWLSFVASELHKKVLWPIYSPTTPDTVKTYARESAERGLTVANARIESQETLLGGAFTVADAYLFWALTLFPLAGVSLDAFPALGRYRALHRKRPAVHAALSYEKQQYEVPFAAE